MFNLFYQVCVWWATFSLFHSSAIGHRFQWKFSQKFNQISATVVPSLDSLLSTHIDTPMHNLAHLGLLFQYQDNIVLNIFQRVGRCIISNYICLPWWYAVINNTIIFLHSHEFSVIFMNSCGQVIIFLSYPMGMRATVILSAPRGKNCCLWAIARGQLFLSRGWQNDRCPNYTFDNFHFPDKSDKFQSQRRSLHSVSICASLMF